MPGKYVGSLGVKNYGDKSFIFTFYFDSLMVKSDGFCPDFSLRINSQPKI